eukprot:37852-Eustigmatos_ZCMA.PRE.1
MPASCVMLSATSSPRDTHESTLYSIISTTSKNAQQCTSVTDVPFHLCRARDQVKFVRNDLSLVLDIEKSATEPALQGMPLVWGFSLNTDTEQTGEEESKKAGRAAGVCLSLVGDARSPLGTSPCETATKTYMQPKRHRQL